MKCLFAFVLVLLSLTSFSQFRNTEWGMTKQQVIEAEKIEEYTFDGTYLTINDIVDGMICEITFRFDNEKLKGGLYSFKPSAKQKTYDLVWAKEINFLISNYGNPNVIENDNKNLTWHLPKFRLNALYVIVDKIKLVYVSYDETTYF